MGKISSLNVPGYFDNIRAVCDFVVAGAAEAGFAEDELFRLELACDEACTNIIEHAYRGEGNGEVTVSYQVVGEQFIIRLEDQGRPFDPAAVNKPDMPHSREDAHNLQVGGLGMHIMRQVMDEIEYRFNAAGNVLLMRKRLPGGDAE